MPSGVQTCARSEEHTSELQSHDNLVCRLLLEKKKDEAHELSHAHLTRTRPPRGARAVCAGWRAGGGGRRRRGPPEGRWGVAPCFFLKSGPPPDAHPFPPREPLPI